MITVDLGEHVPIIVPWRGVPIDLRTVPLSDRLHHGDVTGRNEDNEV